MFHFLAIVVLFPGALSVKVESSDAAEESAAVNGTSIELSERGYAALAATKSQEEMMVFVHRVLKKEGLFVTSERHLQEMVSYYSGQCATQSYAALIAELRRGTESRTGDCGSSWVAEATGLNAARSFLQQVDPYRRDWLSWLFRRSVADNAATDPTTTSEPLVVGADALHVGMVASLDDRGYLAVASTRSRKEMAMFVHRVLQQQRLRVKIEGALQGMLPYYSGECDIQSFSALVNELHRGASRPASCFGGPWLEKVN